MGMENYQDTVPWGINELLANRAILYSHMQSELIAKSVVRKAFFPNSPSMLYEV